MEPRWKADRGDPSKDGRQGAVGGWGWGGSGEEISLGNTRRNGGSMGARWATWVVPLE